MRTSVKIYFVIALALCLVMVGARRGWFRSGTDGQPAAETAPPTEMPVAPSTPAPAPTAPRIAAQPAPARLTEPSAAETAPATAMSASIDDVLSGTTTDDKGKVQQLLALIPKLPEDDQTEAAHHIANLVTDEGYATITPALTNAQMPAGVLDALFTDLLNRSNAVKLPAVLEVARHPDHPLAGEAKDILEVFVEEDYGADWAAWSKAVENWLKENPE